MTFSLHPIDVFKKSLGQDHYSPITASYNDFTKDEDAAFPIKSQNQIPCDG